MRLSKRRGSALLLTMIVLMVTFTLGSAFLVGATGALMRGRNDMMRAMALNMAEAGVEKAVYSLRQDDNWRPDGSTTTITGIGSFVLSVSSGAGDNAGKYVIESTGTTTITGHTAQRKLRAVFSRSRENVSPWNNVIFGGVGQAGKSIQGNVVMRGSVHLLGDGEEYTDLDGDGRWDDNETYTDSNHNGQYDLGEPFVDTDGDGKRDTQEPFVDVNGNGTRDAPLTVTDMASDISGSANIGNNYSGMPSALSTRIPALPTRSFGGETVDYIVSKLRVKHGRVDVSGSATVGAVNQTGGSPAVKETMEGTYVSDGYGGNKGTSQVYSDNGTSHGYDLADIVHFPTLQDPITVGGTSYATHAAYLDAISLAYNGGTAGDLTITYGTPGSIGPDGNGNSMSWDSSGHITINGIVKVNGNINFNRSGGSGGGTTFTYSGRGTIYATGNIEVHANLLSTNTFPTTDAMGFIARQEIHLATGSGDSQLSLIGAFYAQNKVTSVKQNEIAGTFVTSFYSMTNVPHMYQVPTLHTNLPPGMPGATPIWIVRSSVDSWRDLQVGGG